MQKIVGEKMKHHFEINPDQAKAIIEKVVNAARAREAARKARETVEKALSGGGLPGKLNCSEKIPQKASYTLSGEIQLEVLQTR